MESVKNMSTLFGVEMNFQLSYFLNTYLHDLGTKNIRNRFKYYEQYRKNEKYVHLSHFLLCIQATKKPCKDVWLYFKYLTRADIHQSQVSWRAPFLMFSAPKYFDVGLF